MFDTGCGAYVQFEGWVRDHNEGQQVLRLEYEVYEPLAIKEGERIIAEAGQRFGVRRAAAIHRSGMLELTDVAVIVGVSSPHRGEAFDACRYIIDQVKSRLPIWKKEHYANGKAEWVNCRHCTEAAHR
jgi:molybdopterin synthase catalytic subunit